VIEQVRQEKSAPSRLGLRTLVRRDASPALIVTLEGMSLERGRQEVLTPAMFKRRPEKPLPCSPILDPV